MNTNFKVIGLPRLGIKPRIYNSRDRRCIPLGHLSSYYQYSLKRVRITYNNAYRILHGIRRWVSAREAQVVNHIYTFDAL